MQTLPQLEEALDELKLSEMVGEQADKIREDLQEIYELCYFVAEPLDAEFLAKANKLFSKEKQANDLQQKAHDSFTKASTIINQMVSDATKSAAQKAQETDSILKSWGTEDGDAQSIKADKELLARIRSNKQLMAVSRILGKYINIISDKKKNSFTYGLGQKYDISSGNDINSCLSSDLALLGTPETQPLFSQKYANKSLKQYRKREQSVKGCGDIVVCIDESGSMMEKIAWAKAFALALVDIAIKDNRKCAVIRFDHAEPKSMLFEVGKYTTDDMLRLAEGFLSGGTDFEKPLKCALKCIESGFNEADVIFITDGECEVSQSFIDEFLKAKYEHNFMVQGVLLDKDEPTAGDSLVPFCDKIFLQSEMELDDISVQILSGKID